MEISHNMVPLPGVCVIASKVQVVYEDIDFIQILYPLG